MTRGPHGNGGRSGPRAYRPMWWRWTMRSPPSRNTPTRWRRRTCSCTDTTGTTGANGGSGVAKTETAKVNDEKGVTPSDAPPDAKTFMAMVRRAEKGEGRTLADVRALLRAQPDV